MRKNKKIIFGVFTLLIIVAGYFGYKALKGGSAGASYVMAAVEKGALISSVSGTGQVASLSQVDLKAKVSGEVVSILIKSGDEVKTGAVLLQLDSSDTQKAVRDAENNLESAMLSLEKLKQPADELALLQAENGLLQAQQNQQKAQSDLAKSYEDGFNAVSNGFLDLPAVMAGLYDILYSYNGSLGGSLQDNISYFSDAVDRYDSRVIDYKQDANDKYVSARTAYDQNFQDYKAISRFSDKTQVEALISQTYDTTRKIAEAVKSANNLIQFYKDKLTERGLKPQSLADTYLATLNSQTGKTNSHMGSLLSAKSSIQNAKDSALNTQSTITERTVSLANLKAGADPLDIKSQELSLAQRESALLDAQEKLADSFVKAPFVGVIASVAVKKGDSVFSGGSLGVLISKQKIAEISLNEVDASQVKAGQKVTLTFDAVDGLEITGQVAEIDGIGTVSQGVVSYNVKIGFDTQDERIKPGMSVQADIITQAKQNVLLAPNSAVKTSGDSYFVEILDGSVPITANIAVVSKTPPKQQAVEVGLSNDSFTEIISGLGEGDLIVSRTNTQEQTSASSASTNRALRTGGSMMFGR